MTRRINEPLMTLWFGNFYRPAFDNRAFIDQSMKIIREMGFNCVQLDSKAWEDFRARYADGEASRYIAQQEYMMEAAHREGLAHSFMALYLNGDKLLSEHPLQPADLRRIRRLRGRQRRTLVPLLVRSGAG